MTAMLYIRPEGEFTIEQDVDVPNIWYAVYMAGGQVQWKLGVDSRAVSVFLKICEFDRPVTLDRDDAVIYIASGAEGVLRRGIAAWRLRHGQLMRLGDGAR